MITNSEATRGLSEVRTPSTRPSSQQFATKVSAWSDVQGSVQIDTCWTHDGNGLSRKRATRVHFPPGTDEALGVQSINKLDLLIVPTRLSKPLAVFGRTPWRGVNGNLKRHLKTECVKHGIWSWEISTPNINCQEPFEVAPRLGLGLLIVMIRKQDGGPRWRPWIAKLSPTGGYTAGWCSPLKVSADRTWNLE